MAQQIIDNTTPADSLVVGATKINANFTELYTGPTILGKVNINLNAASMPTAISGETLHFAGADATNPRLLMDAFGGVPIVTSRRSNGTKATPTAVQNGEALLSVGAYGYGATGYSSGGRATVNLIATQNWTDAAQGARISLLNTPNGSTTQREIMSLEQDGSVSIPLGQIKFPGTQNPSSDANTLDDYEEGSWTPVLAFGGASVGITYSAQNAMYIKIGGLVWATCNVILTSKGSSTSSATITGLPFASTGFPAIGSVDATSMTGLTGALSCRVDFTNTYIRLRQNGATGAGDLNDTFFTNTSNVIATVCYRAA